MSDVVPVTSEANAEPMTVDSANDPVAPFADGTNPGINPSLPDEASDGIVISPMKRTDVKTSPIDPREMRASWPIVIAYLEQMSSWGVLALRLGTLALIQDCVKELAKPDADPDIVAGLRKLVDALAHMPMEA